MNNARARHFRNLEQHVSSMIAQIEFGTPSDELANARSSNPEKDTDARVPKAEEYSPSNTYLVTLEGGYRCTYPGCTVKTAFSSKAKFENHQLHHFPKQLPCLDCDQVFERMESCRRHHTQKRGGE